MNEFCAYARAAKPTHDTPHIEECIQLFNGLTIWVVCNILRELTIVKRSIIIEKFVDCTKVGEIGYHYLLVCVCFNMRLAQHAVPAEASLLQYTTGCSRRTKPLLHSAAQPNLV